MLPVNIGGHTAYQDLVVSQLRKYYPDFESIPRNFREIMEHCFLKDLSFVDEIMKDRYSIFGPEPRLPSCMLRSYMLSLKVDITSFTSWANHLKVNPIFAIISGFEVGDTPGIGTFYDFNDRLWLSDGKNLSPHERQPKVKVKKPKKKGEKAESVEKMTMEKLFELLEAEPPTTQQPYKNLFEIFKKGFLDESIDRELIDPKELALAGDGTSVVTSARERKRRICKCKKDGITDCQCDRFYSQPDCNIGWDSSRDCFFHGYSLYSLTVANSENDLPLFPLLHQASRHDSHGFLYTWFTMKAFLPEFNICKILGDSAHDAMPIYEYCRDKGITPFIDLNEKRGIKEAYKEDFTIGKDGVPKCPAGLKMNKDGSEPKKYRLKYRCPQVSRKYGNRCSNPCSDAKYGRTVHLAMKDNPRLINIPPRDSEEWKLEYNARTSAERNNKRQKIDYKLEDGNHRSSREWYCRLFVIMMCQHLDAWDLPFSSTIRNAYEQAA
jgi:hypothetical protein